MITPYDEHDIMSRETTEQWKVWLSPCSAQFLEKMELWTKSVALLRWFKFSASTTWLKGDKCTTGDLFVTLTYFLRSFITFRQGIKKKKNPWLFKTGTVFHDLRISLSLWLLRVVFKVHDYFQVSITAYKTLHYALFMKHCPPLLGHEKSKGLK